MSCNTTENFIVKSGLEVADSATFTGVVDANTLNVSGSGGLNVTGSGGLTISDGGLVVNNDVTNLNFGLEVSGGTTIINEGIRVDSGGITILSGGLTVNAGDIIFPGGLQFPTVDGTANQVMITDGNGNIGFESIINILDKTIIDDVQGYSINFNDPEDGDLLIYDSAAEEFRLSRISEQHIINGGQY